MNSQKILNEEDPFLREIWVAGYDKVINNFDMTLSLIRIQDNYIKKIRKISLCHNYKIITAILWNGRKHSWLSNTDESSERFQELIKPEN